MNFSNIICSVFEITDIKHIDVHIINKLKKNGYLYLIHSWKRLQQIKPTLSNSEIKKIEAYYYAYLKIYLIDNDLQKGIHEYIDKLCQNNGNEYKNISLQFFYNFVKNLKYEDLESFILNIIGIINIINIKKYSIDHLMEFYNIIIKNNKLQNIIIQSNNWSFDDSFKNEHNSYLGKLINKPIFNKYNWKTDINKLSNIYNKLIQCDNLHNPIYDWLIQGIELNLDKLKINSDNSNYYYSNNLITNIFVISINNWKIFKSDNKIILIDIDNINEIKTHPFFITYWYFKLSLNYIMSDYILYEKEITYIDTKIIEICKSPWWDTNELLRIEYISKLKKKKSIYKKKIKLYSTYQNDSILNDYYIDFCKQLSIIIQPNLDNEYVSIYIETLFTALLNCKKCLKNPNQLWLDVSIHILQHDNIKLFTKFKCIEYLANTMPTQKLEHFKSNFFTNNLISTLLNLYENIEKLDSSYFYERFEPRYHISFLIRLLIKEPIFLTNYKKYNRVIETKSFEIYIMNDINELFQEIIQTFDKITELNLDTNVNVNNEDKYSQIFQLIETFTTFFYENLYLLYILAEHYSDELLSEHLCNKIIESLCHIIKKITTNIHKYNTLIINNNLNIDMNSLITATIKIIIKFSNYSTFKLLLFDYEKQQNNNVYSEIIQILFSEEINSWDLYYNLLQLENDIKKIQLLTNSKTIPDKFLDPLLNSIILNPVILPDSKQFIDKSTILKHLENNETDPFTRKKLTINELNEYNSLDDAVQQIKDFISERDDCL